MALRSHVALAECMLSQSTRTAHKCGILRILPVPKRKKPNEQFTSQKAQRLNKISVFLNFSNPTDSNVNLCCVTYVVSGIAVIVLIHFTRRGFLLFEMGQKKSD